MKGDRVLWTDGKVYESTIDNNVWSITAYPQGWDGGRDMTIDWMALTNLGFPIVFGMFTLWTVSKYGPEFINTWKDFAQGYQNFGQGAVDDNTGSHPKAVRGKHERERAAEEPQRKAKQS